MKEIITAGFLIRRRVRNLLIQLDIPFTEDRGFPHTYFYVSREDARKTSYYLSIIAP